MSMKTGQALVLMGDCRFICWMEDYGEMQHVIDELKKNSANKRRKRRAREQMPSDIFDLSEFIVDFKKGMEGSEEDDNEFERFENFEDLEDFDEELFFNNLKESLDKKIAEWEKEAVEKNSMPEDDDD